MSSSRHNEVGRWPAVTLWSEDIVQADHDNPSSPREVEKKQEGRCHRILRALCPCLCSESYQPVQTSESKNDVRKPKPEEMEMPDLLLTVRHVDLLKSRRDINRKEHHTDEFECDELVLRRGQPFNLVLELSRPFNPETDTLQLELQIGPLPQAAKGTHIVISFVDEFNDTEWQAKIMEKDGTKLKVTVNSLPTAVIGQYQFSVQTRCPAGEFKTEHDPKNDFYLLFNPWCEDDPVFMEEEEHLKEYVLNETGRIYYGTEKQIGVRTWNYGQFDKGVLEACMFLLERSGTPHAGRGDPITVVRVISAMINAQDDRGLLVGNWSGDYSDGTAPTAWTGSVDILTQYHKSKGTPVSFGQCWIFSGVTTTVLRCLGIPGRSVTNFSSAHDTDVSLTTDLYFDENMEPMDSLNTDSVWNFHVWNDCWMARPDLPPGMGGWQAIDATPQETSSGTYCCGPASVNAVKSGLVYLKYDAPFVFAEVNSDKIYWQQGPDGKFNKVYIEKKAVGRFISTKAVGSDEREDITEVYKHPEGSDEERIAVETACRYGTKPNVYDGPEAEDILVEVNTEESVQMGSDACMKILLKNSSSTSRTIRLQGHVAVMYYTGVLKGTIKKEKTEVVLQANEEKTVEWTLKYSDYQDELVDQGALMMTVSGRVNETSQVLAKQHTFRLRTPDLQIRPEGAAVVGREMTAKIIFTNPLPKTLKNVILRLEGPGLQKPKKIAVGDVGKHSTLTRTETFIPAKPGPRKLIASLDCRQLTQVHGAAEVVVGESN
ncbi:TGM1 glutamyltransferase, partial [Polypterus senegalus]